MYTLQIKQLLIYIPGVCPYMVESKMNLNCLYYTVHIYTLFVNELLWCIMCNSNHCNYVLLGHAYAPKNMSNKQHTNQLEPRTLEQILCLIYVSQFTNKLLSYYIPFSMFFVQSKLVLLLCFEVCLSILCLLIKFRHITFPFIIFLQPHG